MPKAIMESLGLDITRPYSELYSFDSKKVKCLGIIKDLVITLTQLPAKNLVTEFIVVDIPIKFRILFSSSCSTKLKGTLQMDLSFATIPIFGEKRRIYREVRLSYMVSMLTGKPVNEGKHSTGESRLDHPIFGMGAFNRFYIPGLRRL